jgi:regulator of nucleoside diphosphate kinase
MLIKEHCCAGCGASVAEQVMLCRTCAGGLAGSEPPLPAQDQEILVTAHDFMVLEALARLSMPAADRRTRQLIQLLERCRVLAPGRLPTDIVTLNARFLFHVSAHPAEARVLVHPDDHVKSGWTLPITSPFGLAVLGRRAGSSVEVEQPDGSRECVTLLSVMQQLVVRRRRRPLLGDSAPWPTHRDGARPSAWSPANDDLRPPVA